MCCGKTLYVCHRNNFYGNKTFFIVLFESALGNTIFTAEALTITLKPVYSDTYLQKSRPTICLCVCSLHVFDTDNVIKASKSHGLFICDILYQAYWQLYWPPAPVTQSMCWAMSTSFPSPSSVLTCRHNLLLLLVLAGDLIYMQQHYNNCFIASMISRDSNAILEMIYLARK